MGKEKYINNCVQGTSWCLFGLPVDAITMEETIERIHKFCDSRGDVLSTINLNWIVLSLKDPSFKKAVIMSDIITIDGKPLFWISKLFGCMIKEMVPGSSLIQKIKMNKKKQLSIFLFGGEEGVANMAMHKLNACHCGLKAVGALNPGFGTVEQLSSDEIITKINITKPDILLVALGAKKGAKWIELNRNRINAKVISHLGATINFLAESVRRAPEFINRLGFEWMYRIFQEPKLFYRYLYDGLFLTGWLLRNCSSLWRFIYLRKIYKPLQSDEMVIQKELNNKIFVSFGRKLDPQKDSMLPKLFNEWATIQRDIIFDFRKTAFVSTSFLGLLLFLIKEQLFNNKQLIFVNLNRNMQKFFSLFCISDTAYYR